MGSNNFSQDNSANSSSLTPKHLVKSQNTQSNTHLQRINKNLEDIYNIQEHKSMT
jgi:hypothetical protein